MAQDTEESTTQESSALEKVRIVGTKSEQGIRGLTIDGLTEDESKKLRGCLGTGMCWVKTENGRLVVRPNFEEPLPITDDRMVPFWLPWSKNGNSIFLKKHSFDEIGEHSSPSISIQHLCGYAYSAENYRTQVRRLESYGFECLRSRRGLDGRFAEIWHLGHLSLAQGDLKTAINEGKTGKKRLDLAISFLCEHVVFGSLEASAQRACMLTPD